MNIEDLIWTLKTKLKPGFTDFTGFTVKWYKKGKGKQEETFTLTSLYVPLGDYISICPSQSVFLLRG